MSRVYVDASCWRFGRMIMCHMVSPDLDALHAMADRIGVSRRWFQDPRSMPSVSRPHYDIAKSKRELAIAAGAVEVDRWRMSVMSNLAMCRLHGRPDELALALARRVLPADRLSEIEAWLARELAA